MREGPVGQRITGTLSDWPISVSRHSTDGGTIGWTIRSTIPSRSSVRRGAGEHLLADAADLALQFVEAAGLRHQRLDDWHGPLVADAAEDSLTAQQSRFVIAEGLALGDEARAAALGTVREIGAACPVA